LTPFKNPPLLPFGHSRPTGHFPYSAEQTENQQNQPKIYHNRLLQLPNQKLQSSFLQPRISANFNQSISISRIYQISVKPTNGYNKNNKKSINLISIHFRTHLTIWGQFDVQKKKIGSHHAVHAPPFTKKFVHQLDRLIEIPNSQQQNRNPTQPVTAHIFIYLLIYNQQSNEKTNKKT
jgi:hypothetical protein